MSTCVVKVQVNYTQLSQAQVDIHVNQAALDAFADVISKCMRKTRLAL